MHISSEKDLVDERLTLHYLPIDVYKDWFYKMQAVSKLLLLVRTILGRLDQRFYQQRILCYSGAKQTSTFRLNIREEFK